MFSDDDTQNKAARIAFIRSQLALGVTQTEIAEALEQWSADTPEPEEDFSKFYTPVSKPKTIKIGKLKTIQEMIWVNKSSCNLVPE